MHNFDTKVNYWYYYRNCSEIFASNGALIIKSTFVHSMAWLPEPMMPYMVTSLWLAKTFAINYKGTITVSCSDKNLNRRNIIWYGCTSWLCYIKMTCACLCHFHSVHVDTERITLRVWYISFALHLPHITLIKHKACRMWTLTQWWD